MTTKRRLRDHLATDPHLVFRRDDAWFQINVMAGRHSLKPGFPTAAFTQDPASFLLFVNTEELEAFLEDPSIPEEIRTYLSTVRPYSQSVDALTLQELDAIIHADFHVESVALDPLATPIDVVDGMLGAAVQLRETNGHVSAIFGGTHRTGRRFIMARPLALFHYLRALRTRESFSHPDIAISQGLLEPTLIELRWGRRYVSAPDLFRYYGPVAVKISDGSYLHGWASGGDIEFQQTLSPGSIGGLSAVIEGRDTLWSSSVQVDKERPTVSRAVPLDVLAAGT